MLTHEQAKQARFYLLNGHVQGVGFRPFVYRLANECHIHGWVENRLGQVAIHAEGDSNYLQLFQHRLINTPPPHSTPVIQQSKVVSLKNYPQFNIRTSSKHSQNVIRIVSDLPVCEQCLSEMNDKNDRRYHYPFINCTHCGPRYTIINNLPYDRCNTTMSEFNLCSHCRSEYSDPGDRRYHAEPIACPECGPHLEFQANGKTIFGDEEAITACVTALKNQEIVAVKGIGGYHLMVDARNSDAVNKLRTLKPRPHKPLAVMMHESHLPDHVVLDESDLEKLNGVEHPIVLLKKLPNSNLSAEVSPSLNELGVMLPYSPLHHLLLSEFGGPLVVTSANISGEPVLTDNQGVIERLQHVVDACLHHNRSIVRPADDPVYRKVNNKYMPIRLGRGNAPLEIQLPFTLEKPMLAVGGHMKNTVCLAWQDTAVVSPHIGDLSSLRSQQTFEQVIESLQALYQISPELFVCDAHPSYYSSQWVRRSGYDHLEVLHHHAHASCVSGEKPGEEKWLMFSWDGTGYGDDGSIWGGEAFLGKSGQWRRVASFRPFYLPGAEKASQQPWRSALGLCWESNIDWNYSVPEQNLLRYAWDNKLNCPKTTSAGRLFDAAAALIGLVNDASFEGQAPMWLEALASQGNSDALSLVLDKDQDNIWRADWEVLLDFLMNSHLSMKDRARCFHETMAMTILHQALQVRDEHGEFSVGLSGGVFQNALLTKRSVSLLKDHGFRVFMPEKIPVNDGGLCFGQIIEAHHQLTHQGAN